MEVLGYINKYFLALRIYSMINNNYLCVCMFSCISDYMCNYYAVEVCAQADLSAKGLIFHA